MDFGGPAGCLHGHGCGEGRIRRRGEHSEGGRPCRGRELVRDQLVVRVACDTGMRLVELVNLKVGDAVADGKVHYLKVNRKTGERTVTISPTVYN